MLPNKRNTHHEKPKDKNEEWLLLAGTPVYSNDDPEEPKVKTNHKRKTSCVWISFPKLACTSFQVREMGRNHSTSLSWHCPNLLHCAESWSHSEVQCHHGLLLFVSETKVVIVLIVLLSVVLVLNNHLVHASWCRCCLLVASLVLIR